MCGWLPISNVIKREPISYSVNSKTYLDGCIEDYDLSGPESYTCVKSPETEAAYWSPSPDSECHGTFTVFS